MTSLAIAGLMGLALAHAAHAHRSCTESLLPIGGNTIWVDLEGAGNVTVVFEAGFGNESSVWANITPMIRSAGARTFVYDRAGLGKSAIDTTAPYSLDNDVSVLRSALNTCGIEGPIGPPRGRGSRRVATIGSGQEPGDDAIPVC
jgi:hypothetical protein